MSTLLLAELWEDCSEKEQVQLAILSEHDVGEMDKHLRQTLRARGFVREAPNKIFLSSRFVNRYTAGMKGELDTLRTLFEGVDGYRRNIVSVMQLRLKQMSVFNTVLRDFLERAVSTSINEPEVCVGYFRNIAQEALSFVLDKECPNSKIQDAWVNHWKMIVPGMLSNEYISNGRVPPVQETGMRFKLLDLMTGIQGKQGQSNVIRKAQCSKASFYLISFCNALGNFGQHRDPMEKVSWSFAVSACFAAIELQLSLETDYQLVTRT